MRITTIRSATLFLILGLGVSLGPLSWAEPGPIPYRLGDEAWFETGCLPPCMCPVLMRGALTGTLTLVPAGFDGGLQHFEVRDVDWRLHQGTTQTPTPIVGSGTYKVGGSKQQLTLDLSVDGSQAQRYDSGVTEEGESFPRLRVPVALHGFFCRDSVYGVQAEPQVAGVGPGPTAFTALQLGPNPFRGRIEIGFHLGAEGRAELRVHDLAGRVVRELADRSFAAGTHTVAWDGRHADCSQLPAGVYFVSLRAQGREQRGTLVKL